MKGNNKIIIWTKGIDDFLHENGEVGGITVQMYFWSRTFIENDWEVISFSETKNSVVKNIQFFKFPTIRYLGIFIEILLSFYYLALIRPKFIFVRGANRSLSYLRIFSNILKSKIVFFAASDVNFQPGKELINANHDKKLFQYGLNGVSYIVVQNIYQKELLQLNYNKANCTIIPNIWKVSESKQVSDYVNHNLWVGNFRSIKRPEWFIRLSQKFPEKQFIMIGAALDKSLFEKCKIDTEKICNIDFLGPKPFNYVNMLFSSCRVFVCTSEIEGFPNTFLQAWANNKPVITTFDPGGLVKKEGLGVVIDSEDELEDAFKLLSNEEFYIQIQNKILKYFSTNHDAQKAYEKLIQDIDSIDFK